MSRLNQLFCFLLFLPSLLFSNTILVSVGPDKYFVEKIAGDTVTVQLMVPPGVSSHTYEPTPKQALAASHADIWFQAGETFEKRAGESLTSFNPKLTLVDLRDNIDLIYTHECAHHKNCADPHTWLSPKNAKIQGKTILDALTKRYPENGALYQANYEKFLKEMDALDRDIAKPLSTVKFIMVSHPAYGYLARDYGFEQVSLEFEGKDPTPKQLTNILRLAREHKVKTIFIQEQLNTKGARLVADTIRGKVIILDPYSENFSENLRTIAKAFADQDQ